MITLGVRQVLLLSIRHIEYAGAKAPAGSPTDSQKWKIQKLCKILGRTDATELIASLRSVREASGIIDQLQALEAEQKNRAAAQ